MDANPEPSKPVEDPGKKPTGWGDAPIWMPTDDPKDKLPGPHQAAPTFWERNRAAIVITAISSALSLFVGWLIGKG